MNALSDFYSPLRCPIIAAYEIIMLIHFCTEIKHSVEHKRMTWIYYTDNFSGFNEIT